MRTIYFIIALLVLLVGLVLFVNVEKAHAGGPWSNQYCDVETTTIRVVDQAGNVLEEKTCLLYTSDAAAMCLKKRPRRQ